MFQELIQEIFDILRSVFLTPDVLRAVVAVVVAVVAGMTMKDYKFGGVVNRVLAALAIFALIMAFRNLFSIGFDNVGAWVSNSISSFLRLSLGFVLVYFIAFFLVISAAYGLRSAISK